MNGTLAVARPVRMESPRRWIRSLAFGSLAALSLVAFYLGAVTFAQSWAHALQQLVQDLWFVAAISAGFGTQVALFTYLRGLHRRSGVAGLAASTGTSTVAMLACCAHHLTDLVPVLGISSAAIFLNAYKTPLLWMGIVMNLAGIAFILRRVLRERPMFERTTA